MKLQISYYETHRHNITKFLNKLCPNGVGAEIGCLLNERQIKFN